MSENAESRRVGDIMIPLDQYPHIPYWFTLRQAMVEMERSHLEVEGKKSLARTVLVFDEAYKLLGFVRRRDIMRGLEPRFLVGDSPRYREGMVGGDVDPNLFELSHDRVVRAIRQHAERSVREVMLPVKATIEYGDHLVKAIFELVEHDLSFLPVLRDRKVVGVVRTVDVCRELAKMVL
jgi:CBS domain-containing protein